MTIHEIIFSIEADRAHGDVLSWNYKQLDWNQALTCFVLLLEPAGLEPSFCECFVLLRGPAGLDPDFDFV